MEKKTMSSTQQNPLPQTDSDTIKKKPTMPFFSLSLSFRLDQRGLFSNRASQSPLPSTKKSVRTLISHHGKEINKRTYG